MNVDDLYRAVMRLAADPVKSVRKTALANLAKIVPGFQLRYIGPQSIQVSSVLCLSVLL